MNLEIGCAFECPKTSPMRFERTLKMRVVKHQPHFPGPLSIPVLPGALAVRKSLIPESTSCKNPLQVQLQLCMSLGVPQNLWIIDAPTPNHSLLKPG